MNENDRGVFWESDVGFAGEIFAVEPKAKSHCEQATAESKFQRSVLGANRRHHSASHCFINSVCDAVVLLADLNQLRSSDIA